jgi:hypothetical protein
MRYESLRNATSPWLLLLAQSHCWSWFGLVVRHPKWTRWSHGIIAGSKETDHGYRSLWFPGRSRGLVQIAAFPGPIPVLQLLSDLGVGEQREQPRSANYRAALEPPGGDDQRACAARAGSGRYKNDGCVLPSGIPDLGAHFRYAAEAIHLLPR